MCMLHDLFDGIQWRTIHKGAYTSDEGNASFDDEPDEDMVEKGEESDGAPQPAHAN